MKLKVENLCKIEAARNGSSELMLKGWRQEEIMGERLNIQQRDHSYIYIHWGPEVTVQNARDKGGWEAQDMAKDKRKGNPLELKGQ